MIVCYMCHTKRTDDVLVAEDIATKGLAAMHLGDVDHATKLYREARDLLLVADVACRVHIPPLFVAAQNERNGFDEPVWLPSLFGTYVMTCAKCFRLVPCIDCDQPVADEKP